ncbi:hypothetical protein ON010_g18252 [Phytophthora cinnamomi]|nr:hypothetical protein ON010_g18252 [Phytophthora cinnamomi]
MAGLKQRLTDLESSTSNMGSTMFEMMLQMHDVNERKAELRRADGDQRRRGELAAREARYLVDKEEAEERRHQEKLDMEERVRRDKEDAGARSQELMLSVLTKKD